MQLLRLIDTGGRVDDQWLWRHLSLDVDKGDCVGIIGPSGAGKSQFLRAIAGLRTFDEGRVAFCGSPVDTLQMPEYRSRVILVAQTPALIEGSVRENLKRVFGFRSNDQRHYDESDAVTILKHTGRDETFLDKSAANLSGGERQIAAFIRAIQLRPDILLLDEPTASLDERVGRQLHTVAKNALRDGLVGAIIRAAHQPEEIAQDCSRTVDFATAGPGT